MPRFHSQNIAQVYRQTPRIAHGTRWLSPLGKKAGPIVFTISATDSLYLLDTFFRHDLHQQFEGMFLLDTRQSLQEHRQQDKLYLLDTFFKQALLQRTDMLLMGDARLSLQEHRVTDGVYLLDLITKTVLFLLQDGLYLLDTATVTKIAGGLSFLFTDYLLLGDIRQSLQEHRQTDGLYLLDTATVQRIAGLLSFLFTDYLFLNDVMTKTELHRQTEGIYVADTRVSTLLKQLLDTFLFVDRRYSVMQVGPQDQLLLNEFTTKFLHAIRSEGMYLNDIEAHLLITAVVEMIAWARLRATDPLGTSLSDQQALALVRLDATDPLGTALSEKDALAVRNAVRDLLGVLLQTTKPRLH